MLFSAAWIAGGDPAASPVSFVDIHHLAARASSGSGLVLWRLVGVRGPVSAWRYWPALCVLTVVCVAALLAVTQHAPAYASRLRSRVLRTPITPPHATTWARRQQWPAPRGRHGSRCTFVLGSRGGSRIHVQPESSVLVVGPTRSGKTSALVAPNLLRWSGPAIVTSTKGELVDVTAGHRQSIGPVYVYDPTGEMAARCSSLHWSPLSGCETLDHAWRVAAWLCAALQQQGRGDNDWAHWAESAKLLVAPLFHAAALQGYTVNDVCAWVQAFDLGTAAALLEEAAAQGDETHADDANRALSILTAVDQRPEKERGTVFSTVMRLFSAFNERAVAESAAWSRFDADEFLRRSGTLYLCTPRQSPERVSALFAGLLMTVVTAAYHAADATRRGRLDPPLGLFLDELANVVPIEHLPALASQGAGRGVVLMSIVQDLSQLRARYGVDRANSILNNHVCKVVLPGIGDPETADVLSRLMGQREYTDVQVTRGDGRTTQSYARRREPLASADALRRLHPGSAVVIDRGAAPMLVQLQPWFSDASMRRLAALPHL
ncbi:MAG TPA: type IV secretory system conjugative DNA transfer family protein, partial [Candidatus Dormibacteraeota bacterium]|nr:type IV secretory system conjugative DNA transfer family protein [Candidatus Dormibacteraeota bacterium]